MFSFNMNDAKNKSSIFFSCLIVTLIGLPIAATSQTYEQTRSFCRISQMLIPIFLEGGKVPGKVVCETGGGNYNCRQGMSLGEGVCVAGGGGYNCRQGIKYAEGVCIAGGSASFECVGNKSLGEAVCMSGRHSSFECSGISDNDLGEGICKALGGSTITCRHMPVHEAVCGFTRNCKGYDAASIAVSMVETCGVGVLHYGIE